MNHPKRTFQKPMSLELHDFGCRENRDSTSHFIAISEEKSTFLFYTYIKSPLISWKIWRSICIIALWDESSCIPSFWAKLRQIIGEETHRATIDCVSTMAANEAKWVKQIIIRGLMCVTVKFDTIIHYKVCMDNISIHLHPQQWLDVIALKNFVFGNFHINEQKFKWISTNCFVLIDNGKDISGQ